MRGFSSAFPDSWPGVGLLLVRAAVGLAAVVQGGLSLFNAGNDSPATLVVGAVALLSGAALLIGFLTPGAGVIAGAASVLLALPWLAGPASVVLLDRSGALFVIVDAIAIVLLGPGAISLDARLFGRREIVIPHEPHLPRR